MHKPSLRTIFLLISSTFTTPLLADQVVLDDGSLLKGSIKKVADGQLVINTAFADDVTIDYARVSQMTTDKKYVVELNSRDRIVGQLTVDKNGQHKLTNTAFGTVNVNPANIKSVWETDAAKPQVAAVEEEYQQQIDDIKASKEQEVAELKDSYETAISSLRDERNRLRDPWSGSLAFGATGSSGNTKRFGAHGRGELNRETDLERMNLYFAINFQKEDGEQTVNEKLAGMSLERDISDMWFARGAADFEIDEFEQLDLRAIASASLGRFFIREDDLKFKGFAGVGYRYEGYSDGTTNKDPTGVLGYAVDYRMNNHLKLFHDFSYYPSFSSPGKNYLLVTNFGGEMPLADDNWKLRASVRAQHNSQPVDDAKRTDTTYQMDLVYDWD
jgi:putative salt-induced outer membrane protein YdiY